MKPCFFAAALIILVTARGKKSLRVTKAMVFGIGFCSFKSVRKLFGKYAFGARRPKRYL